MSENHRQYIIERNLFMVGFLTMIFSLPYMGSMVIFAIPIIWNILFLQIYFYLSVSLTVVELDLNTLNFIAFQLPWLTDLKLIVIRITAEPANQFEVPQTSAHAVINEQIDSSVYMEDDTIEKWDFNIVKDRLSSASP